jgi:hypothetical protein
MRLGTLAAVPGSGTLRVIRMPASNPTSRAVECRNLAAVRAGLVRYARAGETVRAAVAAKRKSSGGLVAHPAQVIFEKLDDLHLLATRQLGDLLDERAELASRRDRAAWSRFAQQLLDGDAKRLGHRQQHVRTRQVAAAFPIMNVGVNLADAFGQFALAQPGRFAERLQMSSPVRHGRRINRHHK